MVAPCVVVSAGCPPVRPVRVVVEVVVVVVLGGTLVIGALTTVTFSACLIRAVSAGFAMIVRPGRRTIIASD